MSKPPATRSKSKKSPRAGLEVNRVGGPRALAVPLGRITRARLGRRSLAEAELIAEWASVAGRELAGLCIPRRIVFPNRERRRDGTLVLACKPGQNLRVQHMEPVLLGRVNGFFGYPAIARLRLEPARSDDRASTREEQAPRRCLLSEEERRALQQAEESQTSSVADDDLRAALRRLARTLSETQ